MSQNQNDLLEHAANLFAVAYGYKPKWGAFAPGRVNIIGGHTDYNDGLALPIAIGQKIITLAAPRTDSMINAVSLQVGTPVSFDISDRTRTGNWDDAIKGVIDQVEKLGGKVTGMDLLFSGDVPLEAGLSSSAAFVVSAALCITQSVGIELSPTEVSKLAQRVENEFMGTNCGILDQMASAASKNGHALFLDCRDLTYDHVPFIGDFQIVVCHTGVTRSLAASKYNERRKECEQGLKILVDKYKPVYTLREVSMDMLDYSEDALGPIVFSRLRHVLSENIRVLAACDALAAGDFAKLGALINESHESLREDYQVSCKELDIMCKLANEQPGCFGARMIGGGFGGCAIAVVEKDLAFDFARHMDSNYFNITETRGKFIPVTPGPGASQIITSCPVDKPKHPYK